ncbi:cystathionine beta-lyase [Allopusillimonas soli]|uniref:Cystathionine beta-lyase n=1 Tax=Allopusillimonas soli TaxID=659016 RepID=A0A853FF72_9BURK|nr:cystathionine beta-lyase [Allopusillimonas soli]NYT37470.1 cystathionine beta-lyase [Allopusillimonas soli]TEA74550.1 cystathionine beta-lyase [Allopusillimonas soli]
MDASSRSTRLARMGRPASGWANTPIVKGSTYLFESIDQWRDTRARREKERVLSYGARGNETVYALEDAVAELEGGHRSKLFPTGLAAIAATFLACLKAGDHVLISEGVYQPVRRLCADQLVRYGISHSYFDPRQTDMKQALKPETRMVYTESPGSLLYDMLDLPAMAEICRPRGITLCADNTWGSGFVYHPLALGCDISIMAATKYLGGHSDVMMGTVTAAESHFEAIENVSINLGQTVSAEDAFLVLRGLRTLGLRMKRHAESALEVATWLAGQSAIRTVYHPALQTDPNHALWRRDARGSNGLLTVEFQPALAPQAVEDAIGRLRHFGIGSSWGGFESLLLPVDAARTRLSHEGGPRGYLLRLHVGLEDVEDIRKDLGRMLDGLPAVSQQQAIAE